MARQKPGLFSVAAPLRGHRFVLARAPAPCHPDRCAASAVQGPAFAEELTSVGVVGLCHEQSAKNFLPVARHSVFRGTQKSARFNARP